MNKYLLFESKEFREIRVSFYDQTSGWSFDIIIELLKMQQIRKVFISAKTSREKGKWTRAKYFNLFSAQISLSDVMMNLFSHFSLFLSVAFVFCDLKKNVNWIQTAQNVFHFTLPHIKDRSRSGGSVEQQSFVLFSHLHSLKAQLEVEWYRKREKNMFTKLKKTCLVIIQSTRRH